MKDMPFATGAKDPWCPGCGHTMVIRALQEALGRKYQPSDVILVTDIGCIGMADLLFTCHTVHGLHGRSPALATGIALTLGDDSKKVVVLMGDGGAAIGLQHIMECARLNVDLTLVVCNNQNYGMTGGQHSAYTLPGVKTNTTPAGSEQEAFPLCELVAPLGVQRSRVLAADANGLARAFDEALALKGFALIETLNYCPSYTGKMNPDTLMPRTIGQFFSDHGLPLGEWPSTTHTAPFRFEARPRQPAFKPIERRWNHQMAAPVRIIMAGSAGEGVQSAAEIFARAAVSAGLEVVVRGEYPVTVGKGFSSAHLLMSPRPILTPAGDDWDLALVTSADGLKYMESRLAGVRRPVLDTSLAETPGANARFETMSFRRAGAKQAGFAALVWLNRQERWIPEEAIREVVAGEKSAKLKESLTKVLDEPAASI